RYFDVFIEYAKAAPDDLLIRIRVCNRGKQAASLHVLPTIWFRNTWSAGPAEPRPQLKKVAGRGKMSAIAAAHPTLGVHCLQCEGDVPILFTENETNTKRVFGTPNAGLYVKDGINEAIVHGKSEAVNPKMIGTKAAAHYQITVGPNETKEIRLRLTDVSKRVQTSTDEIAVGDAF